MFTLVSPRTGQGLSVDPDPISGRRSSNKTTLILNQIILTVFPLLLIILFLISDGFCSAQSISVESVLQKQKTKEDIILVDVRDPRDFEKFHIPGSINIPLFALKTKIFLKSKRLILFNEGRRYKELIDEGAILSQAGFSVSILDGGLRQWQQKKGPIEGDVFAARQINKVPPQVLTAGMKSENWILIDISTSAAPEKRVRPSEAGIKGKGKLESLQTIRIPFSGNEKGFILELRSIIKDRLEKDFLSLVIIDEKEKHYEAIEKQIQAAGIGNVFYLEGGLEAYRAFEKKQNDIAQATNAGMGSNGPKKCPTCK